MSSVGTDWGTNSTQEGQLQDISHNGNYFNSDDTKDVLLGTGKACDGIARHQHDETDSDDRQKWSRKAEFILTMMGYCVGLGNVWRFPYVCIRNGGGTFLFPYLICLTMFGMPLYFLEVSISQFVARGVFHVWSMCPLFKGIGISMVILSVLCAWYYGMLLAWILIYLFHSVRSPLPWTLCGQEWNSPSCVESSQNHVSDVINSSSLTGYDIMNSSLTGYGVINSSLTGYDVVLANGSDKLSANGSLSTEEFLLNNVLELSPGLEEMGGVPWHTAVALLVSSVIAWACILKGIKTVGKVVYVTAILPYLLLGVLLIRGVTLPGSGEGVSFYVTPDFSKLWTIQTWVEASVQVFYSLGVAGGGLITMASYNKFSNNCMRDAVLLSFLSEATSIFAGFAIFSVLGHMAYSQDVPVGNFSRAGIGLAFIVYPEAVSYLPIPQLWAILFFLMLFTIGLDTQFAMIEVIFTTLSDFYPKLFKKKDIIIKVISFVAFYLLSLTFAARGGMYVFQLVDWYFAAFTPMIVALLECLILGWIYGAERLLDDIEMMIGKRPPYLFSILWRFVSPLMLLVMLVGTLTTYQPPKYEGYVYGEGWRGLGWFLACLSFIPIPVYAGYAFSRTQGAFRKRLKTVCSPAADWLPQDGALKETYRLQKHQDKHCQFRLPSSRSHNLQ